MRLLRVCLAHAALVVAGTFAGVVPWAVSNAVALGAPVFVSNNGGSNLYRARNERAAGAYIPVGPIGVEALAELPVDPEGKRLALEWTTEFPTEFALLGIAKLLFAGYCPY